MLAFVLLTLLAGVSACIFDQGKYKKGGRLDTTDTRGGVTSSSSSSGSSSGDDDDDDSAPIDSGASSSSSSSGLVGDGAVAQ